jgi:hypothetical protein
LCFWYRSFFRFAHAGSQGRSTFRRDHSQTHCQSIRECK